MSPFRRAMLTAYHVYKNHPSFNKIKFIMVPELREHIEVAGDVPSDINEVVKSFKKMIPNLNTSLIPKSQAKFKKFWFLDALEQDLRN